MEKFTRFTRQPPMPMGKNRSFVTGSKAHWAVAKAAAIEGTVLLKNDGTLPLSRKELKRVAVIGPNAMSHSALSGNYCGLASEYVTVTDGIRRALPDARIYYAMGTRLFDDDTEHAGGISTAAEAAKRQDRQTNNAKGQQDPNAVENRQLVGFLKGL